MKPVESLIRYMLTIDWLERNKRAVPTQELLDYVNDELEKRAFRKVTLRTLQRDFIDIDLQFGYKIKNKGSGYTIEHSSGYLEHRFDEMLLDFDMLSSLNSNAQLQRYVLAEHHRPIVFVENLNYEKDEQELIDKFNPPLNLDKNKNKINSNYRQQLSMLRRRKIGE